jgi:hypothetical protein
MTNTLPHTGERPGTGALKGATASRILVMGPAARAIAGALVRMRGTAEIHHAETAAEAIELLSANRFDHVLVDNRADGALALTIPRLAGLETVDRITVLSGPVSAQAIAAIPKISAVITPPYNPIEIANSLGIEVTDSRRNENQGLAPDQMMGRRAEDDTIEDAVGSMPESAEGHQPNRQPSALRLVSAIACMIPGLTPLFSMLYKNLALAILAALFVAFVGYGIMIAFFLVSGDWASPLQLQPGHELVVKAEREFNELQVKRNLVSQQLSEARNRSSEAKENLTRANRLAAITGGIIDQEIATKDERFSELQNEIETLKSVLTSFGSPKDGERERKSLERDYKQRLITRGTYQSSLIAQAQIERQRADMSEELTAKMNELRDRDQSVAYLANLKLQLNEDTESVPGPGQAVYVPLANQIMEVRQIRSSAKSTIAASSETIPSLENSYAVLTSGLNQLEVSPMIRALEKPITVLFVPYDNLEAFGENQPLYACAVAIFWCSNVGTTGKPISGEIVTTHPFFGKPIRGQFVEAILTDPSAAKKEIFHVGRPPLFL